MRRRWVWFTGVAFLTLALDQGSKAWARGTLETGRPKPVIDGYWDWDLSFNPGAAFSTLGHARVLLSIIAIVAIALMVRAAWKSETPHRLKRVALAILAGGAAGNLVDRLWDGVVTDFVHWHAGAHDYPVFNVADVALWLGVGLLLIESLQQRRSSRRRVAAVSSSP